MLRERGLVGEVQREQLKLQHRASGRSLADLVIAAGLITERDLLREIAAFVGCDFRAELPENVPAETIAALSPELAETHGVFPLAATPGRIDLAMADPFRPELAEDLAFVLGKEVRLLLAAPEEVRELIGRYYGRKSAAWDEVADELTAPAFSIDESQLQAHDLEAMAGQPPVIRFVNGVLGRAVRDRASDIHFEPFEDEFKIRYRVDGTLQELPPPPRAFALPIASRIKVLANLNIAERRVPQDGRIRITLEGRTADLRVSTLPTQFGESVVVRVLDQSTAPLELSQLGLSPDVLAGVNEIIRRPHGIFVVTGPTGSGKTTTLYSGLNAINSPDRKILTAEDPVEYEIEGLMQVPVNPGIGLTFASALRSFLRQDPDVIMVGEIRDPETAQISIQAALTGHLVISTLHTNDAAGAVTRLVDLGVEPFLIASTLEAVLAQRLLRRACRHCRTAVEPLPAVLAQLGLDAPSVAGRQFFCGRGCAECDHTGYQGRVAIYEWLRVTEPLRELIVQRAPALILRDRAINDGMRTLRQDGLRVLFAGETTVEEVLKYT